MARLTPGSPARRIVAIVWILSTTSLAAAAEPAKPTQRKADDAAIEFYEKRVRPILAANCYECHGDDEQESGLSVANIAAMLRGGDQGPALVPGDPDASLLIQGIRYDDADFKMPPKAKLSSDQIKTLTEWVKDGALGPDEAQERAAGGEKKKFDLAERARHWCFQPLSEATPPAVNDAAWCRSPLDRFVLAKLEAARLHPAADTDRRTLIRRVYFDLVGLPPTPEEVEAFVRASHSPTLPLSRSESEERESGSKGEGEKAYEAVVDTLLASPHFGERWARHWLDLVRYAETRGHEFDPVIPNAYQYRDYVIRALNADVPYDQFVKEHLAGDVLPQPRLNPSTGGNESILGTGFWWLGEEVHSPVDIRQDETDRVDNKIDVLSKTFLGVTLACARCHDHKFDALSTKDYYALSGFALSMSYRQAAFEVEAHNRRIYDEVQQLETKYRAPLAAAQYELWKPMLKQADVYLRAVAEAVKELQRGGKQADRAAIIAATATAHDLDEPRLSAWLTEFESDRAGPFARLIYRLNAQAPSPPAASPVPAWTGARVVYDVTTLPRRDWLVDGLVYGTEPARVGEFRVSGDPARPINRVFTATAAVPDLSWDVVRLAPGTERDVGRLNWLQAGRTLKSNTFTLQSGKLAYLVRGSGHIYAAVASHRINQGPLHGKLVTVTTSGDQWRWVEHDLSAYVGQRVHVEFTPAEAKDVKAPHSAELAVRAIIECDRPLPALPGVELLPLPTSASEVPSAAAAWFETAARALCDSADTAPLSVEQAVTADWIVQHPELWSTPSAATSLPVEPYFARRAELVAQLKRTSQTAPAAFEGTGVDEYVLVRGQHKSPGDLVPRRFLEAIDGPTQPSYQTAGGRLELAQRLLDRRDPLPARVMVNRVWYHLLGRGIVKTVDNFGSMGDAPTHPELLDHLAREFMADGWSVKGLIKRIVLSSTYRQSSAQRGKAEGGGGEDVVTIDPNNELIHRANIKRLDAEIIRDALLAVSGRLDRTTYGPGVELHLTQFMEGRGRPGGNGPLDGAGRRSVYLRVRRNFLNPMFQAFDYPTPFTAIGRRTSSNVPAQALALLNGPLVGEMSTLWAKRMLGETTVFDPTRIERLYQEAFSRPPTTDELQAAEQFLQEQRQLYAAKNEDDPRPWADLCHVLFNVKEFIYIP